MTRPHSQDGKLKSNKALESRLLAYAAGAGAAAAGLLTLSMPANAEIVFTQTNAQLRSGSTFPIVIDGTTQFTLTDKFFIVTGSFSTALFSDTAAASAAVVGRNQNAAALKPGAAIGPADQFKVGKALLAGAFRETQISSSAVFGRFANTTNRFLGLKFVLNGEVHYGWARFHIVTATANGPNVSAILAGYAYETVPNQGIVAGQTTSLSSGSMVLPAGSARKAATLQPATLGLLALGSSGLSAWRRKEALEVHN